MTITDIAARVHICTLKTGAWRPIRLHRAETRAENARHNIKDAARVLVRVCDHPALAQIQKIQQDAYAAHIRITRPTVQHGMRLIPLAREIEHNQAIALFAAQHAMRVAEFMADYDNERATAPGKLNGLYDPSFWPSLNEVRQKFVLQAQYLPCPTEGDWGEWLSVSVQFAQLELREQLQSAIRRIAERCAANGPLYQTVFSNLGELLELVPDLDLVNDPQIRDIARQAKALANRDREIIANTPLLRRAVAAEADRLCSLFQTPKGEA